MAQTKQSDDDKPERLKQYGAFNPHPEKVTEESFLGSMLDFFDPRDLIQVKYEMLRAVDKEGRSVKEASEALDFPGRHFIRPRHILNRGG